jgi:hypothetical protein
LSQERFKVSLSINVMTLEPQNNSLLMLEEAKEEEAEMEEKEPKVILDKTAVKQLSLVREVTDLMEAEEVMVEMELAAVMEEMVGSFR